MIEKLVALIREKHKDSDSLIVADVLEQHGDKIANEIVGAALCELFGFLSPPDQGVILNKANVIASRFDKFASLEIGVSIQQDTSDSAFKVLQKSIYDKLGRTIYGIGPHFVINDENGNVIRRDPA